ncbi:MAG: hydroxysqualene dehydroxylase HpnE [Pseudazoarcus pumilus]|nr:hydroxysqualene dehydroxylase HpnE [Pseudazoarcus pumilus]
MACAVELTRGGAQVTLFERSHTLGGRARVVAKDGRRVDNGQHILIGAYTELARLMRVTGQSPKSMLRLPLTLLTPGRLRLVAARLPAPLHLAVGLLRAQGLSWADRRAMLRLMNHLKRRDWRIEPDCTVSELLRNTAQTPRLIELIWVPLCVAALNTHAEEASAQVFANVLRDSLGASAADSELLIPRTDLTELFPVQAARYLATRRGRLETGSTITAITRDAAGFALAGDSSEKRRYDQVVIATAPYHAGALLRSAGCAAQADAVDGLRHEPITTVYLELGPDVRLPAPMIGLTDGPAQWAFDRGALGGEAGLIACVISASGPHGEMTREELEAAVLQQLERQLRIPLSAPNWSMTITEKRATIACTPGLQRPGTRTPVPGLWLAGDYLDSPYPATLESAVRSGCAAAAAALAQEP